MTKPTLRRLLIVRPDRVGDVVISSSCLPLVRDALPHTEIFYAARPVMAPLFEDHPDLGGFVPLPPPGASFFKGLFALRRRLAEGKFDAVVSLHPDPQVYLAAWLAGIPQRMGYKEGWTDWTLTRTVPDRRREHQMREASYNFDLLRPLGIDYRERDEDRLRAAIALQRAARETLKQKLEELVAGRLRHYVCLHPTAFSPIARWPVAHYLELARLLRTRHGVAIVLVGHQQDDPAHREFRAGAQGAGLPFVDLTGKIDLAELAWLLKGSLALVTRDTGPSHLAAAVDCPVVVLFGRVGPPYGPTRWAPLGHNVEVLKSRATRRAGESRDAFFRRTFAEIPVADVYEAVARFLPQPTTET